MHKHVQPISIKDGVVDQNTQQEPVEAKRQANEQINKDLKQEPVESITDEAVNQGPNQELIEDNTPAKKQESIEALLAINEAAESYTEQLFADTIPV